MNLVVDVGNTLVKLAVFEENKLFYKKSLKPKFIQKEILVVKEKFKSINKAILSSVGDLEIEDVIWIKNNFDLLELDAHTKLPFENLYKTPNTLGLDRIGLVCASVQKYPNKNVLIIDAGTCITYDFVNKENEYLGGAISPGMLIRYKALNDFTAKLPLLEPEIPDNIIGNSTKDAIHSGVIFGVLNEMDGVIKSYKLIYKDLTVILTGGDTNFLSKQLKSSIFANSNFLLEGLNYILHFNTNQ